MENESVTLTGFKLITQVLKEQGEIYQTLTHTVEELGFAVTTDIYRTKEAQFRQALIQLGWTPPNE